jgi:hypothetical protein
MSQPPTPEGANLSGDGNDHYTGSPANSQNDSYTGPATRAKGKGRADDQQQQQRTTEAGPSRRPPKKQQYHARKENHGIRIDRLEFQLDQILAAINQRNASETIRNPTQSFHQTVETPQSPLDPSPGVRFGYQTRIGSSNPRYTSAPVSGNFSRPAPEEELEDPNDQSPEEDISDIGPSRPSRKTQLTEKITPLDDGINPTYQQWRASVRDRLTVNHDHYSDHYSRKALI